MNNNRRPVTIRLNLQEQQDLRDLIEFFTKPGRRPTEKDIFKIALSMLVDSSKQLQRSQQQAAPAPQETIACDTPTTPESSDTSPLQPSAGVESPAA